MAREMKDSGIAWIGEIPKGWEVKRLKNVTDCLDSRRIPVDSSLREKGPYPYWGAGSIVDYINDYIFDEEIILLGEDGAPFFDPYRPVSFLIKEKVWVNNHTHVLKARGCVVASYICYALNTLDYTAYITGSILTKLTQSKMNNLELPLPPLSEQRAIATFLDEKCGEIDELVALQEKMIEELKAYKQAVITETVTKGLDKNVKMKDSGVEWIGQIPKEWEVCRFRNIATVKANLVHPYDYLDYPQVAPDCIGKGNGLLLGYKTVREANVISDNHLFHKGQIVYSKIRPTLNKLIIAEFDGLCSADMYPIETSNDTRYQLYYMLSDAFLAQVALVVQDRVKMPKINQEELAAIKSVLPPLPEQHSIANYLDTKCADIDALISIKQKKIDELKNYKKSLIYEYVTGKKQIC